MRWKHFLALVSMSLSLNAMGFGQTMTVIQTASTNRPEIRVTVPQIADHRSAAVMAERDGNKHEVSYSRVEQERLWNVAAAVGPVASLPASQCMKSASFGTRLYVEIDGQRSPDLSCPNQSDTRTAALRTEVEKLLSAASARLTKGR